MVEAILVVDVEQSGDASTWLLLAGCGWAIEAARRSAEFRPGVAAAIEVFAFQPGLVEVGGQGDVAESLELLNALGPARWKRGPDVA